MMFVCSLANRGKRPQKFTGVKSSAARSPRLPAGLKVYEDHPWNSCVIGLAGRSTMRIGRPLGAWFCLL